VAAAEQDFTPRSPFASRCHHALDHDAALDELRSPYGWPAPEDPDASCDDEVARREPIAERLGDQAEWLRDCARWLVQLDLGKYPPVTNLLSEADHPERCNVAVDAGCVRRVLLPIAADIDELVLARSPNPRVLEANAARIGVGYRSEARAKRRTDRVGHTGSYRPPSRDPGDLSNC
jgi:hypothetical protein